MNEEIVTKLATESIKPVSTVVDALLGPKLERIKIAARKREIAGRLDHAVVNDLLDQYLRSLIRRVSEITTIVFPQQNLPLSTVYEPLLLHTQLKGDSNRDSKFELSLIERGRNFFLVDRASAFTPKPKLLLHKGK